MTFELNGDIWTVTRVPPDSIALIDRLGTRTVATTDPTTMCIYLSDNLRGDFKKRVIAHELGHATCFSYGLLPQIRRCCYPSKRIYMEEFICNFVAEYGEQIFALTYEIIGDLAYDIVIDSLAKKVERLAA